MDYDGPFYPSRAPLTRRIDTNVRLLTMLLLCNICKRFHGKVTFCNEKYEIIRDESYFVWQALVAITACLV